MQRVFIYGSCVTRDGVDFWSDYGLELTSYVARQSLISATAPAAAHEFRTNSIASPFQRRMAEGDVVGNVVHKLIREAEGYDLILWDITDERLGVYPVPSGGYVTRVVEYNKGIYAGHPPLSAPIRVPSASHHSLWLSALDTFISRLEQSGLRERVILNALPWATVDESGLATQATPITPQAFNEVLHQYSVAVEERGIKVARPDPARVIQASEHKWGAAPFHYTADTYRASLEAITALV